MVRIALPNKGRLLDPARTLLDDAGLEVRLSATRALTGACGEEYTAIFARSQDIPEFVADGAADAGITGWDLVCESSRELQDRLDLQFGRCRLVLAVPDESRIHDLAELPERPRVATAFPRLTSNFFRARGSDAAIVQITGAVEAAPRLGIADVVVDITSTGSTLRANGLREIATIHESSARLVTRAQDRPELAQQLDSLAATLASVVRARGQRYLMANVPRAALGRMREVLPGLNGPTITRILDGDRFVAVHAVVPAARLSPTISALRALGAEGILVTRIERLVP